MAVLAISIAIPALALGQDDPVAGSQSPGAPSSPSPAVAYPQGPPEALQQAGASEDHGQDPNQTPATPAEQQSSQDAYADDNRAQSRQLLEEKFPDELSQLDQQPGRALDPSDFQHYFSDTTARVDPPGPQGPQILISSSPLRTEADNGTEQPVNLDVHPDGGHYVADNPLVDVSMPANANGQLRLQDAKVGISLNSPDASQSPGGELNGDKVFYHDAAPDTDLMVAPVTQGAELFEQIRSVDAPEKLSYHVDLPDGAELRAASGEGLEVVRSDQRLALITDPSAVDAAGNSIPTHLEQTGPDSFDLFANHRSANAVYPILVDPGVEDWYNNSWAWGNNQNFNGWSQATSGSYFPFSYNCFGWPHCWGTGWGLYLHAYQGQQIPSGPWSQWQYTVPGSSTFISYAAFAPIYFARGGENNWATPYAYWGVYSTFTGRWPGYNSTGAGLTGYGQAWSPPTPPSSPPTNIAVFGIGNNANRTGTKKLTAARTAALGGMYIQLGDQESPTINDPVPAQGYPAISSWLPEGTPGVGDASVTTSDAGLGVQSVSLSYTQQSGAQQVYTPPGPQCVGTRQGGVCDSSRTDALPYNTSAAPLPEGVNTVTLTAMDALGSVHTTTKTFDAKVDRSSPAMTLSGGLYSQSQPGYDLHVTATDGTATSSSTADRPNARSGAKRVDLYMDNGATPIATTGDHTCTNSWGSCPLSLDYTTFDPQSFSNGTHHFKIVATDQLGHQATQEWDRVIDPAPDTTITAGPSGTATNASPSFTFSSSQPLSSFQCRLDSTAWESCTSPKDHSGLSEGPHLFEVRATNGAGLQDATPASRSWTVHFPPDTSIDSGPTGSSDQITTPFTFSSPDPNATFECQLNAGDWTACSSPKYITAPADGANSFSVRAIDATGVTDPTPAQRSWTLNSNTNGPSGSPSLSSDGGVMAFQSQASNLVGGDTNGAQDIFVYDGSSFAYSRVSVRSDGQQANGPSSKPSISANDRYVTFESDASNLVPGDTNGARDAFVYDREAGTTQRVSVDGTGGQLPDGGSSPVISGDGRYIAYVTADVAWSDSSTTDTNGQDDVYVYDRQLGQTVRLASSLENCVPNYNGDGWDCSWSASLSPVAHPSISYDGSDIAFDAAAYPGFVPDSSHTRDVYVHWGATTFLVSFPVGSGGAANGASSNPSISGDGQKIAYQTTATNITNNPMPDDSSASDIIYFTRSTTGVFHAINASLYTHPSSPPQLDPENTQPSLSNNDRIAFASTQSDPADTNGVPDIYELNMNASDGNPCCTRLSYDFAGGQQLTAASSSPAISSDGVFAAYGTASDFADQGDTNGLSDIHSHQWFGGSSSPTGSSSTAAASTPCSGGGSTARAATTQSGGYCIDGPDTTVPRWTLGLAVSAAAALAVNAGTHLETNCGVPLYHYSDQTSAASILASKSLFVSEPNGPHPSGAYATTISPFKPSSWTQSSLAQHIFHSPGDTSWWVLFCSNLDNFVVSGPPAPADYWYIPASFPGTVEGLHPFFSGPNEMDP